MPGVSEWMSLGAAGTGVSLAHTGWKYNRAAFTLDQTLRWSRFTTGRKFAQEQTEMFRQDVEDLAHVAMNKLKTYGPIMTMSCGYCVTVFVEGRSGLKFPAPPTFISGLYLQCLGIGFAFFTLATWFVFHAALRAQVAAVHLRTRKVRIPVPTQSQLDNARKLLSSYEEQNLYDVFKLPYVMPNAGAGPPKEAPSGSTMKGKKGAKNPSKEESSAQPEPFSGQFPGMKEGVPNWIDHELAERDDLPGASPSGHGSEGPTEPFEHFEYVREAQKEWWGAEVYNRVCMLFGMMHVLQAFAYWLVIHCMTDLALVWCGVVAAAGLTAGVFLIFRLDVLPDQCGCWPIETSGPFVASIAIAMMYTQTYTQFTQDLSRGVAAIVLVMHILQTFRMYALAKPSNGLNTSSAKESGGRRFNQSGACDAPSWLPSSFQVVTYLVAPPASKTDLKKQRQENDTVALGSASTEGTTAVDMTPWYYTRVMIFMVFVGWCVLLAGRIVEAVMGERMLTTNPGAPPWTRRGLWYGWEFGPITSKHYAHVTPQRGHYAWELGWGPQGQQELWPSDLFGFHPEADMWWSEDGVSGAAFHGENTWAPLRVNFGTKAELHAAQPDHSSHTPEVMPTVAKYAGVVAEGAAGGEAPSHGNGAHRRLRGEEAPAEASTLRTLIPAAVQWPALFEPVMLACGPRAVGGAVAAITSSGFGALVPPEAAAGRVAANALTFSLEGLGDLGGARGLTWNEAGLFVVTSSGSATSCAKVANSASENTPWSCQSLPLPPVPFGKETQQALPAAIITGSEGVPFRVAVAALGGKVKLLEIGSKDGLDSDWRVMGEVTLPLAEDVVAGPVVTAISASSDSLLVMSNDGVVHQWPLRDLGSGAAPAADEAARALVASGRLDVPGVTKQRRTWLSACALPDGNVVRLASSWRKVAGDAFAWQPEFLL